MINAGKLDSSTHAQSTFDQVRVLERYYKLIVKYSSSEKKIHLLKALQIIFVTLQYFWLVQALVNGPQIMIIIISLTLPRDDWIWARASGLTGPLLK